MIANLLGLLGVILVLLGVLSLVGLILAGKAVTLLVVGVILLLVAWFLSARAGRGPVL